MSRKLRLSLILGGGLFFLFLVVLLGLYWASRYEPDFYGEALVVDEAKAEKDSDEMLRRVLAFQGSLKKEGTWQAVFSAQMINHWFAVDFQRNHSEALPPEFKNPRLAFRSNRIELACLYEKGPISTVLCLTLEPYVSEANVLSLRIVKARAGLLPLPLTHVLDGISKAARHSECRLLWKQTHEDPVALLTFPSTAEKGGKSFVLESVRVKQGEIVITGETKINR